MIKTFFGRKKAKKSQRDNFQRAKFNSVPAYAQLYVHALSAYFQEKNVWMRLKNTSRGARWVTVEIMPVATRGALSTSKFISKDVERALMVLSGSDRIRFDIRGGALLYQFQLPKSEWIFYTRKDLPNTHDIGIADGTQYVSFDVVDQLMPHSLVVGGSGSGKSTTVSSMIFALMQSYTPQKMKIAIIDVENEELYQRFRNEAHLFTQVSHDSLAVIDAVYAEFTRRVSRSVVAGNTERLVLFVDEALSSNVLGTSSNRSPAQRGAVEKLHEIAQRGRRRGVHLVIATQEYVRDDLPFVQQLRNRFIGSLASARESVQLAGIPKLGAQSLSGKGDFLSVPAGGDAVRFQVAMPTQTDYASLPRADIIDVAAQTVRKKGDVKPTRRKAGRPSNKLDDPKIMATYIYRGKSMVPSVAKRMFGLTRHHHQQYKDYAAAVRLELRRYYGTSKTKDGTVKHDKI